MRHEDIVLRLNEDDKFVVVYGHLRYASVMASIRRHRPWYVRLLAWIIYR